MKVVCIDDDFPFLMEKGPLTKGKIYEVMSFSGGSGLREADDIKIFIVNDRNTDDWFYSDRFLTLQEYRNEKLNQILQ